MKKKQPWEIRAERERVQREQYDIRLARWKRATPAIMAATAAALKKASLGRLAELVLEALKPSRWDAPKGNPAAILPIGSSADDILRHAAFLTIYGEAGTYTAARDLPKQLKGLGVDALAIMDKAAPAPRPEQEAEAPAGKARTRRARL